MILALAMLAATQAAEASAAENCSPPATRFIESTGAIWAAIARQVGLSPAGEQVLVKMQKEHSNSVWCITRSESDVARERLLSVLAAEQVDEAALAEARQEELAAILRDEKGEVDRLVRTLKEMSPEDRRKLATWLRDDLRRSWTKRERAAGGE